MPLYEYQCDACGHRFEVIQKFSDALVALCPQCGGAVRKLFSSPAIQFKGSGWYITDYARAGQSDGEKGSSDKADKEQGSSDKAESGKGSTDKAASGASSSETKSDSKTESKADTKTESKSDSKPDSKPSTS